MQLDGPGLIEIMLTTKRAGIFILGEMKTPIT